MTPSTSPAPRRHPELGTSPAPRGTAADATTLPAMERWRRALGALAKVVADPDRTDQVLEFGIYANAGTMKRRVHRFYEDPRGRLLYEERRTLDSKTVDLDALGRLPAGSLGRAYADFMRSRGITPEIFDGTPQEVADPRIAYAIQRIRQTHDLWHVVTGYETDPFGEIVLQAFTFAQLRAPSSGILAAAGTLRGLRARPTLPHDVITAFRAGRRAERIPVFLWEDHWETPLVTVRQMLGIRAPVTAPAAAAA